MRMIPKPHATKTHHKQSSAGELSTISLHFGAPIEKTMRDCAGTYWRMACHESLNAASRRFSPVFCTESYNVKDECA